LSDDIKQNAGQEPATAMAVDDLIAPEIAETPRGIPAPREADPQLKAIIEAR